jgi:hypothetical protein
MTTAATIAAKLTLDQKEYSKGLNEAEDKAKKSAKNIGASLNKIGASMMKTGGINE